MTEHFEVDVRRDGRRFDAEATLVLPADVQTVWDTITDYGALHRFMPGIRDCKVVARKAGAEGVEHLEVEQLGEFRFLMFAQSMKVHLHIEHQHLKMAEAKAWQFDLGLFRRRAIDIFEGRYELAPVAGKRKAPATTLRYTAVIGLHLPPPPAIGNVAIRQNLSAQLQAVAAEVARRSAKG
jgi:hypothetical protein